MQHFRLNTQRQNRLDLVTTRTLQYIFKQQIASAVVAPLQIGKIVYIFNLESLISVFQQPMQLLLIAVERGEEYSLMFPSEKIQTYEHLIFCYQLR